VEQESDTTPVGGVSAPPSAKITLNSAVGARIRISITWDSHGFIRLPLDFLFGKSIPDLQVVLLCHTL
jgi:hypothetical protein